MIRVSTKKPTPLRPDRGSKAKSAKPLKRRRQKPRKGPLRDPKFRAFVRIHPCAACRYALCGCRGKCDGTGECVGVPVDAAHSQNNGMRSKGPDSSCAPLCRKHHREYDSGRTVFEMKYGVDMPVIAAKLYVAYLLQYPKRAREPILTL